MRLFELLLEFVIVLFCLKHLRLEVLILILELETVSSSVHAVEELGNPVTWQDVSQDFSKLYELSFGHNLQVNQELTTLTKF